MRQSIVSRLGRIEAAQRSRVVVGRDKALTDERVRNALAVMTVSDALDSAPLAMRGSELGLSSRLLSERTVEKVP
jgi:hypothetical protein